MSSEIEEGDMDAWGYIRDEKWDHLTRPMPGNMFCNFHVTTELAEMEIRPTTKEKTTQKKDKTTAEEEETYIHLKLGLLTERVRLGLIDEHKLQRKLGRLGQRLRRWAANT